MHIPDGFISPKTYIPLYAVSSFLWAYGFNKIKKELDEKTIPKLAILTALSFLLMTLAVPIPGGTSVHGVGAAILSLMLGPMLSFISISLSLLIQTVIFGMGGITSLPVNSLCIGFIGSYSAYLIYKLLNKINENISFFLSGYLSLVLSSFFVAIILGIQPFLGKDLEGKPLFFPFGLGITIPALLIPHLIAGVGEGILTLIVLKFFKKFKLSER